MNEPHELRNRARRWLRWAEEDLAMASAVATNPELVSRGACLWAQQAAEKALKALLVGADVDPPKVHSLGRLNSMLTDPLDVDDEELRELSRWSIDGRYPADLDEATASDAHISVALATRVIIAVSARLPKIDRPER